MIDVRELQELAHVTKLKTFLVLHPEQFHLSSLRTDNPFVSAVGPQAVSEAPQQPEAPPQLDPSTPLWTRSQVN